MTHRLSQGLRAAVLALAAACAAVALTPASVRAQAASEWETSPRAEPRAERGAPASLRSFVASLPEDERRLVVRHLRNMRPLERRRFVRRWEHARPAQLERIKEHMWRSASRAAERQRTMRRERARDLGIDPERLEENRRAWESMGDAKQRRMRARLERFAELSPKEQEAVVSVQFADRTEAERGLILEKMRAAAARLGSRPPEDP